jgi:two-component system sensor histidine kinase RegB
MNTFWPLTGTAEIDSPAAAGRKNMGLLIQLRWIAVIGQVVTIVFVHNAMGIRLPVAELLVVPAVLIAINLASLLFLQGRREVTNWELLLALLLDVGALTWQLHLSGGATNPFEALFLLQVVLGAMLLRPWSSWVMVCVTCLCVASLRGNYRPLVLPAAHQGDLFALHLWGSLVCFALVAILLAAFVSRSSRNLRERDASLADIRQQAAEENHILRMGLLASGAAHELGTPLSSVSVILGDWQHMPKFSDDPEIAQDIADMQAELQRCKTILTGILLAAGEARGIAPQVTTMRRFLDEIIDDWRSSSRSPDVIHYEDRLGEDLAIVSDPTLKQVISNVIDNAAEVSPAWIGVTAWREENALAIEICDAGPGFTPEMLAKFGQPYQSSKGRPGGGLGLFLLVNVLRKLGGHAEARNRGEGGAAVKLSLPLATIGFSEGGR